jgi:TonB-dependent starch-binding outer membrane protein SusC
LDELKLRRHFDPSENPRTLAFAKVPAFHGVMKVATPPARRGWAFLGILLLGLIAPVAGAGRVHGQETATLRGVVAKEESGDLIRSATVTLVGTELSQRTGEDGTFVFLDAPLGRTLVRVQADGFPAMVEEIDIVPGTGNVLPVFMQSAAVALEGILVFGNRSNAVNTTAKTAADLLANKYPALKPFVASTRPNWPQRLLLRGRNSFNRGGEPVVVIDGVRMMGDAGFALSVLKQIPATDVKRLEILEGPSAAFLYGGADGAIIVETESRPDR